MSEKKGIPISAKRTAMDRLRKMLDGMVIFPTYTGKSVPQITLNHIQFELFCEFYKQRSDGNFYYKNVKINAVH